jgi:hypothetical protein
MDGIVIACTAMRRKREESMKQTTALVVIVAAAAAADENRRAICQPPRVRRRFETGKVRPTVDYVFRNFSDVEFSGALRLDRKAFNTLLQVLMTSLKRETQQGNRCSSGIVRPCVRVAITLRMLAGGSVWELMAIFGVGRTTVYHVFHSTLDAIYQILWLPGIPVNDLAALTATAEGFKTSRASINPL